MNAIITFAKNIENHMGITTLVEPTNAHSNACIRLAITDNKMIQTDIDYQNLIQHYDIHFFLDISLQIKGANLNNSLLTRANYASIRFQDFMRKEGIIFDHPADQISPEINTIEQSYFQKPQKKQSGFFNIGDEKLFLYKEEWSVLLTTAANKDIS
jgi:hypothetical protein